MTVLSKLERKSMRTVAINTAGTYERQPKSRLLSQIPPEVRLMIFKLAIMQQPDKNQKAYSGRKRYSRTGHKRPNKTDTSLLLVCRQLWLEAYFLPFAETTHTFWYAGGSHEKLSHIHPHEVEELQFGLVGEAMRWKRFFDHLTPLNLQLLTSVHIFACEVWLAALNDPVQFESFFNSGAKMVQRLKITMREGDWDCIKANVEAFLWMKGLPTNGANSSDYPVNLIDELSLWPFRFSWLKRMLSRERTALPRLEELSYEFEVGTKETGIGHTIVQYLGKFHTQAMHPDSQIVHYKWVRPLEEPVRRGKKVKDKSFTVYSIIWKRTESSSSTVNQWTQDETAKTISNTELSARRRLKCRNGGKRSCGKGKLHGWTVGWHAAHVSRKAKADYLAIRTKHRWAKEGSLLRFSSAPGRAKCRRQQVTKQ